MRHGIAARNHVHEQDFDISLTNEGIELLESQSYGLKKKGVLPNLIISSPFSRAKETAEIIAKKLNPTLLDSLIIDTCLTPKGYPELFVKNIFEYKHFDSVLVVGHQPLLGSIASYLDNKNEEHLNFDKGTVCLIEVHDFPEKSRCQIKWLLSAQELIEAGMRL